MTGWVSFKRWCFTPRALVVLCALTTSAFLLICGSVLLETRRAAGELARSASANLAATIDSDIVRSIEVYDLSLRNAVNNMLTLDTERISLPILHLILFDHAATAQHYGRIRIFDETGKLKLDSSTLHPAQESCADKEFFKIHRASSDAGLYVSDPEVGTGAPALVLSRRITGHDGRFLGVVVGSIRYSYFRDLFSHLKFGEGDTATVFRNDGRVMMRQPSNSDTIGKDLSNSAGVRQILATRSGSATLRSTLDNIERLYVWQNSDRALVVVVGKSLESIYGPWWRQVFIIGGLMLMLSAFVIGAAFLLAREMARRADAEQRLAQLATTDALTGIDNRRRFDERMLDEWRRGWQKLPLSLLMIDADHFKTFNDLFGHQEGDQVLVRIAKSIAQSSRRPADCAARYGGEEFALLLPDTELDDAMRIAEEIRTRVERLSTEKWATTVSIGVACVVPDMAGSSRNLIEAADKALYQAKEQGRNCCVGVDPDMIVRAA